MSGRRAHDDHGRRDIQEEMSLTGEARLHVLTDREGGYGCACKARQVGNMVLSRCESLNESLYARHLVQQGGM